MVNRQKFLIYLADPDFIKWGRVIAYSSGRKATLGSPAPSLSRNFPSVKFSSVGNRMIGFMRGGGFRMVGPIKSSLRARESPESARFKNPARR